MKLKAFDLMDIEDFCESINLDKLKNEIKPYIIYFVPGDTITICLQDNVKKIKEIITDSKNVEGFNIEDLPFDNLDKFYKTSEGWDYTYLGDIEIDGDEVWKEFGKLLKEHELSLLNTDDFEREWFKIQKYALRNILDKEIKTMKENLDKIIQVVENDFGKHKGIYK